MDAAANDDDVVARSGEIGDVGSHAVGVTYSIRRCLRPRARLSATTGTPTSTMSTSRHIRSAVLGVSPIWTHITSRNSTTFTGSWTLTGGAADPFWTSAAGPASRSFGSHAAARGRLAS